MTKHMMHYRKLNLNCFLNNSHLSLFVCVCVFFFIYMYAPKDLESEKFALEDDLEFRVVFLFCFCLCTSFDIDQTNLLHLRVHHLGKHFKWQHRSIYFKANTLQLFTWNKSDQLWSYFGCLFLLGPNIHRSWTTQSFCTIRDVGLDS